MFHYIMSLYNYINIEIATILEAAVKNHHSAILLLRVVQMHISTISVERFWAFFSTQHYYEKRDNLLTQH